MVFLTFRFSLSFKEKILSVITVFKYQRTLERGQHPHEIRRASSATQALCAASEPATDILGTSATCWSKQSPRGNGFSLKDSRFRLDIRQELFTVRVARHWNRTLKEGVDASGSVQA